ncbi:MAG: hypothetical protein ACO4BU_11530 [Phycisphaerales bacterium]
MPTNNPVPRFWSSSLGAIGVAFAASQATAGIANDPGDSDFGRPLSWSEWSMLAEDASSAELVVWLEDDSIPWNASAAAGELRERVQHSERADDAVAALWPALESPDRQAANVAAGLLQQAILHWPKDRPPLTPTLRLLEVSVDEAIQYRGYVGSGWIPGELNTLDSVRFIERFAAEAVAFLLDRFEKASRPISAERCFGCEPGTPQDETARFMAAYFLARVPGVLPIEVHAAPLIEALEDNWRSYDALMGMVALDLIGPRAAGPVRRALAESTDAQQRACLGMLLAHWEAPPGSDGRERAIEALRKVRVTWKVRDPLAEWAFDLQTY